VNSAWSPASANVASGYAKSGTVLAAYLYAGHLTSIEKPGPGLDPKLNGYSDYLFFQYLARTQGPDTIRQIFDALAGGRNSVEAIAAAVDMKSVWPAFARTLWIGWEDKVLDYWANEDEYRFGLAQVYAQVPTVQTIPQEMKDQAEDDAGRPEGAEERAVRAPCQRPRLQRQLRGRAAQHPLRAPEVQRPLGPRRRLLQPDRRPADNGPMKLEALKKIGGKWQPPEDWTPRAFQTYCLDNQDERLEELLLIVSNSDANRASETPFVISNLSPMKQATSNVGCWQWFGSASVTTETAFGYTTVESMTGPFVRFRALSDDPNDKLVGAGRVRRRRDEPGHLQRQRADHRDQLHDLRDGHGEPEGAGRRQHVRQLPDSRRPAHAAGADGRRVGAEHRSRREHDDQLPRQGARGHRPRPGDELARLAERRRAGQRRRKDDQRHLDRGRSRRNAQDLGLELHVRPPVARRAQAAAMATFLATIGNSSRGRFSPSTRRTAGVACASN
jgi:hypothetical protein